MKLTKQKLKEIIKEELEDMGQALSVADQNQPRPKTPEEIADISAEIEQIKKQIEAKQIELAQAFKADSPEYSTSISRKRSQLVNKELLDLINKLHMTVNKFK
jgi:hypothetical protein